MGTSLWRVTFACCDSVPAVAKARRESSRRQYRLVTQVADFLECLLCAQRRRFTHTR
jgi:hypothetical protein